MKTNLISVLVILALTAAGRADGKSALQVWPDEWTGDTALFVFEPDTDQLQLNAPREAAEAYICKSSGAIEDASWKTFFHFDFNPSSANFLKIYLATDGSENFENGFYLIAGTTNDNICLWERRNGEDRLLIEGAEDRLDHSPVNVWVRVRRNRGGNWLLETDSGDGWQKEGEAQSDFGFPVSQLGFSCHYTKTRCDKFRLGPLVVSGDAYRDTVPPQITDFDVLNGYSLNVDFSEKIDPSASNPGFATSSGALDLDIHEIKYSETATEAVVKLDQQLPDAEEEEIALSGWCDEGGNEMADTTIAYSYQAPQIASLETIDYRHLDVCFNKPLPPGFMKSRFFCFEDNRNKVVETKRKGESCFLLRLKRSLPDAQEMNVNIENMILPDGDTIPEGPYSVYYHEASPFDLVVTEVMHDPSPPALLPETEYIELFNRSALPVDLKNMNLQINGKDNVLPAHLLFPDEYVVLFRKDEDDPGFPNSLSLDKWHALTNGGGEIVLRNPSEEVVTALRYPVNLSGKTFKQQGGWSFEVIDPGNVSGSYRNWTYCQNEKGGSPGKQNSVDGPHPDVVPPSLKDAWLKNDSVLVLDFGEVVKIPDTVQKTVRMMTNGLACDTIFQCPVFRDRLSVVFQTPLEPHKVEKLEISENIADWADNTLTGSNILKFGLPGNIDSLDLVINELMFDSPPHGGDYLELFNLSDRIAALDSICLARADDQGGPEELVRLSDRTRWFLPGEYICFTPAPGWVEEHYPEAVASNIINLPGLPNYVNYGGTVFLTRKNGQIIDRFSYSPDLHFPLLDETKTVALERTHPEAPVHQTSSWHSASSVVGYGTPGCPNSQKREGDFSTPEALFELTPDVFTPDLDGFKDRLIISWSFDEPGFKGTFVVYNAEGRPVKYLLNNKMLGTSGEIEWDGTRDDDSLCPPGIYIVWAKVFNTEGKVKTHKESCVLGLHQEGK